MYSLKYRITTRAPIIISAISGDRNMVQTEQFIPGTSVLGLLAKRFIDQQKIKNAHEDDRFYRWFLTGKIKFTNAYIVSVDEYGEHCHFPTPLSIEQEKYGVNVYDCLYVDTEDTKYLKGFCSLNERELQWETVARNIEFHHARDRRQGVPKKGVIFNYESIATEQLFEGEILGKRDDLHELLTYYGEKWDAFIGRSRNAQYGAVDFEFVDSEPLPVNIQFQELNKNEISMTLRSDLLLYNEMGYPTTDVDDLEKELQQRLGNIKIKKAFVKKKEVESFVSVWRLKNPSETCFKGGSAFLLEISSENKSELIDKLIEIQKTGIGERIHEGFGRCVFGWQTEPELDFFEAATKEIARPNEPIPSTTKEIIKKIIQQQIQQKLKLHAINVQDDFIKKRLPSNSLIGKLHALAKNANSRRQEFVAEINQLRPIATNQMRRCVARDYNLLEYLAAFQLDENSLDQIKVNKLPEHKIEAIEKHGLNKEFALLEDLREHIKLSRNDKFINSEVEKILKIVRWQHNPIDWFFRQPLSKDLEKLCDEISYQPESDDEFKQNLSHIYYCTFFSAMRKRKIAEEKSDARK